MLETYAALGIGRKVAEFRSCVELHVFGAIGLEGHAPSTDIVGLAVGWVRVETAHSRVTLELRC